MKTGWTLSAIFICVLICAVAFHLHRDQPVKKDGKVHSAKEAKKKDKQQDQSGSYADCYQGRVKAAQTWKLPGELQEISAITWMGDDRLAAIEDNTGVIYIYDLKNSRISKTIKFAGDGDYEGLQYVRGEFYVMRSDGYLFRVAQSGKIIATEDLPLSAKDNIESLYYDAGRHRLLLAQKDGDKERRNIYSYDLSGEHFQAEPLFSLDVSHPVLTCEVSKKKSRFRPSELAVHPKTGHIFIADGPNQRLLVLNRSGEPQQLLALDKDLFKQAEGLAFRPDGMLYISTEGVKAPASISLVRIDD